MHNRAERQSRKREVAGYRKMGAETEGWEIYIVTIKRR